MKGFSVVYCTVGGLLLLSGVKGSTIQSTVKAVLTGNLGSLSNSETLTAPDSDSTSASTSTPTVSATASQTEWNTALLKAIGAPANSKNLASLAHWEQLEEPGFNTDGTNNPLNTTESAPGAGLNPAVSPSIGVKTYPSLQIGLEATVKTLENGSYPDILMQLRAGNGLQSGAEQGLKTWSGSYTSA